MHPLDQFQKQKYLNLETFRRNGDCMQTPVWFVQEGEILYVQTLANSGKVKRIHNNGTINIVPCKMDGKPTGNWIPAQARDVTSHEIDQLVDQLLDKKYGLLKKLFMSRSTSKGAKNTILEIKLK